MKIAQVAPLYESVPPRLYGGTERITVRSGAAGRGGRMRRDAGQEQAGIVEQMASFCDAQARAEVQDPSKLEWSARLPYGSLSTSTVTIWEHEPPTGYLA